jgi:hypothetical protein
MNRSVAVLLVVAGCAGAPQTVPLAGGWPPKVSGYDAAYERWTRRGADYSELLQTLSVSATLQAPDFRAAYAAERSRRLSLTPEEQARLVEAEHAAGDQIWEVQLLMATARPDWNDLRKYDKHVSMWRLALVADDGREVAPLSVREDKRVRGEIEGWFPDLTNFFQPYIVRFPKNAADGRPLVGPGTKHLMFRIDGSRGRVQLVWDAEAR